MKRPAVIEIIAVIVVIGTLAAVVAVFGGSAPIPVAHHSVTMPLPAPATTTVPAPAAIVASGAPEGPTVPPSTTPGGPTTTSPITAASATAPAPLSAPVGFIVPTTTTTTVPFPIGILPDPGQPTEVITTTTALPPPTTTTTTAPGVITIKLYDSALGCGAPGSLGCPLDVDIWASGFTPATTYPILATYDGADITNVEPGLGTTVTTDSAGALTFQFVAETPVEVPFAGGGTGTITVTFGGASSSYNLADYGPY